MRNINIISGLLLIYLLVMSVIGWPGKKPEPDYPAYFLTIGATLIAILLLRYIRIRRLKQNKQWEKEKGEKV